MNQLSLENTLLGVDIICNQQLVASDVDERGILQAISNRQARIVVTVIGGQGHVFGRGNQQLSAKVIWQIISQPETNHQVIDQGQIEKSSWRDNIIIIASNEKLRSLQKRPMISDTGDVELDNRLAGLYAVITGYQQKTLYKLN
jgi:predicted polyphosphate/ATP-dependent NAD kinase